MIFRRVLTIVAAAGALAPAAHATTAPDVTVSVGATRVGPAVPAGFVGLATEYPDIEKEVGTNPAAPDTAFEQVLRNLAPDGGLSLRIGGDTTDWAWWPIPGMKQPPWVRWTMTPTWAAVTQKLAEDLGAHLIVGINMEADRPVIAQTEVKEIAAQLGSSVTVTYEVGNEPELYSKFPYYITNGGVSVYSEPKSYSAADITAEWKRIADSLPRVPLAGPGYSSLKALPDLGQFLDAAKRISLLTVHSYPLKSTRCSGGKLEESQLFEPASLARLAAGLKPWTSLARRHAVGVRVDEINAVTCGGMPHFSRTFGPALWALNILPLYVEAGIQGVNFQSRPYTAQNLIQPLETAAGWRVEVQPEYYGLIAFAQLTPPGSRLLKVSTTPAGLYAWAVQTPSRQISVVLTNVNPQPTTVALKVAGAHPAATREILHAGSGGLNATGGLSLGGQRISATTGQLTGAQVTKSVLASDGVYDVRVPAASAAILTIPAP